MQRERVPRCIPGSCRPQYFSFLTAVRLQRRCRWPPRPVRSSPWAVLGSCPWTVLGSAADPKIVRGDIRHQVVETTDTHVEVELHAKTKTITVGKNQACTVEPSLCLCCSHIYCCVKRVQRSGCPGVCFLPRGIWCRIYLFILFTA